MILFGSGAAPLEWRNVKDADHPDATGSKCCACGTDADVVALRGGAVIYLNDELEIVALCNPCTFNAHKAST